MNVASTTLLTSLFLPDIVVPDNLVAETRALRKECSKVRGTAGPLRASLVQEIAKQKKSSTSKLAYVSYPVPPVPAPVPAVLYPVTLEERHASPPPAPRMNFPSPNLPASDEVMDTFLCFKLASADSLVLPAPSATAKPNRRERPAILAKVYTQSAVCFT